MEMVRLDPHSTAVKPKSHLALRESGADSQGQASGLAGLPQSGEKVAPSAHLSASEMRLRQEKPATSPTSPAGPLSQEQVEQEVVEINAILEKMGHREIHLSLDDESGDVIVQVVDSQSEEVVRQIPPEHVLELRDRLAEMKGLLINEEG